VPRSNNAWSYNSTPPYDIMARGSLKVQGQLYFTLLLLLLLLSLSLSLSLHIPQKNTTLIINRFRLIFTNDTNGNEL
jgi:hypothetical protein